MSAYEIDALYEKKTPANQLFLHPFRFTECHDKRAHVEAVYFTNSDPATGAFVSRLIAVFLAPPEINGTNMTTVGDFTSLRRKQVLFVGTVPGYWSYNADSGRGWRVLMTGTTYETRWSLWVAAAAQPGTGVFGMQPAFYDWNKP